MIELDRVTYRRAAGRTPVLHQLSLTIPEGQWVSIAGPNGSGKSTLLKLMNGLLRPSEGTVRLGGAAFTADTAGQLRRQTGMVFQQPENQFIGQTVESDMAFGLENAGLDRETMRRRVREYAARLSVTELLPRHPGTLSGGQMQRAALAAVLAMEPRVLLFDEATSMLDEEGRRGMLQIMKTLRASGRYTIVAVTHDADELLASDRVIALQDGAVAADGTPKEILADGELLLRCRLKAPFARRLAEALKMRGVDVGEAWNEKELIRGLWAFNSKA